MTTERHHYLVAATLSVVVALVVACEKPEPPPDFVARVGSDLLLRTDVEEALSSVPPGRDSTEAVRQIVEQWLVNTLLEREARESGLLGDPQVQRLLRENERSVLISALIERIYEDNPVEPTREDINRFFELNRERLRLREPFVRVRYLVNASRDSVQTARGLLQQAMRGSDVDSLWTEIAHEYSADFEASMTLSSNYFAQSRLFSLQPALQDALLRLDDRELSPVLEAEDRYHVVQVIERIPEGTVPHVRWVEEEISRQLVLERRKQTVARTVQNLRNMATARNILEVRLPEPGLEDEASP